MAPKKAASAPKRSSSRVASGVAKPAAPDPPPVKANTGAKNAENKAEPAKPVPARKSSAKKAAPAKEEAAASTSKASKTPATNKKTANKSAKETAEKPTADKSAKVPAKSKAAPKAAPKNAKTATKKTTATKRKADGESSETSVKKAKIEPSRPVLKKGPIINQAPKKRLHVFVTGANEGGELGLGNKGDVLDIWEPRLNELLSVGVVQIATGPMHVAALTHDNKILTWGVNDLGALGRNTDWDDNLQDIEEAGDDASGGDLNPLEATPTAISMNYFPENTVFTQLAASDNATFAVTDDGHVYGWGTFRSSEGVMGFTKEGVADSKTMIQKTPVLLAGLKNITLITCGENHVLALDKAGNVYGWGSGQNNQLGRRIVERTKLEGLKPREFGLPRKQIVQVECGFDHSFAIDRKGVVWSWGPNNYGQTGIDRDLGEGGVVVEKPTKVEQLSPYDIKVIKGGKDHSIAVTEDGECLVWGRVDGFQMGMKEADMPKESVIMDDRGRIRLLRVPTAVPKLGKSVEYAACGSNANIAITTNGVAYSWGAGDSYQLAQGSDDDIVVARLIQGEEFKKHRLNWAGIGASYSILTSPVEAQTNGV